MGPVEKSFHRNRLQPQQQPVGAADSTEAILGTRRFEISFWPIVVALPEAQERTQAQQALPLSLATVCSVLQVSCPARCLSLC